MLGRFGCCDKKRIDQASDAPSIIFHNILQNPLQNSFQFIFLLLYNFTKVNINSFECPNYEKNNAWNIRRLVDELLI